MGTARMGDDPRCSVTNAWGETHDVANLYVAGGALFSTGSSVNPTLTILALAWRTAEALARRHGKPLQSASTPGVQGRSPGEGCGGYPPTLPSSFNIPGGVGGAPPSPPTLGTGGPHAT
jgi:hypothetical protein